MESVELFTGAGGLGIATARAGFRHLATVEYDRWCCDTIRENQRRGQLDVKGWPVNEMDVREFDYSDIPNGIDLLAGGPPCQPFSLGGKHRAHNDKRDMFPEVVRAIRETAPKAIIIENVKGLVRRPFASYLEYIYLQMSYPEVVRGHGEEWSDHLSRLEKHHTSGSKAGLRYNIVFQLLNAADYGVPQRRERVFFVGFRSDLDANWSFKSNVAATHSRDRLLWDQWVTGEYWQKSEVREPKMPESLRKRVSELKGVDTLQVEPWRTVRDAISDLPNPRENSDSGIADHRYIPGARSYKGHTGSPLDEPAKTLKAGDHGVPGGENMLRHPNGRVRYFTVRESARLQCFPDDYVFHGSWTETMRQLGNAVPIKLGHAVAQSVSDHLAEITTQAR